MKYQYCVIFIFFSCCFQTFGQVYKQAIPFSVKENLTPVAYFEDLPYFDSLLCKSRTDSTQNRTKHFQFACPIFTDLNPDNSGEWIETPSGRIWRLGIHSANAISLYITMQYSLSVGVKMFVYDPEYEDLRGAFSNRNNNDAEILSIMPVVGDRLIVELNVPNYQELYGEINITKVYHGFYNIYEELPLQSLKYSKTDDCNEDINCTNGNYWQTEKRSVCKIIYNGGVATGALIGNTSGNTTPHILSANHVISSAEVAAEAIFLFNYETTHCEGETTTKFQSLSGATILSTTNHKVDFSLMRPYQTPPLSYKPFYAGWDARNFISNKGVCIHHPFGNYMQIAIDYHSTISEDIGEGFDSNSTWKISHWELGTTELGSSGAPLFNEEHRIIGTLTGGRSTCGYTKDDYFTKFGVSWDTYTDSSNQLKYWLDSAQTGQLFLNGYDPYGFNSEYCDTAWNLFTYDRIGLSNTGLNWGWISGHSSAGYTQFAERFESSGTVQIAGVYLNVAKASSSNSLANIELKIWQGSQYPEKECFSELLFIKDIQPNKVNYIAFDTVLTTSGTFFIGYEINYSTVLDTFALYHALDRGNTKSSMYLYKDVWYKSEDTKDIKIYTSLGIGISECYGKTHNLVSNVLNVYPNPSINSITIDTPDGISIYEVKCFDFNGRPMLVNLKQTEENKKLHFNLIPGIYFLQIFTAEKTYSTKFIVKK
jgi:hypothetical protein